LKISNNNSNKINVVREYKEKRQNLKNLYFIFNHNSKHNSKERINNKLTCTKK